MAERKHGLLTKEESPTCHNLNCKLVKTAPRLKRGEIRYVCPIYELKTKPIKSKGQIRVAVWRLAKDIPRNCTKGYDKIKIFNLI